MLHGEFKVNAWEIGNWSAVRQDKVVASVDEIHTYKCEVHLKAHSQVRDSDVHHQFEVKHRFGDGALALTNRILSAALELEREKRGREPTLS